MILQNKKAEIKFFDHFDKQGGYDVFDKDGYLEMISWMTDLIPPRKNKIIYDLGCGSGAFTSHLYQAYPNCKIIGVDISRGCIKRAQKDFPKIDFMVGDIENLRIKSSSVDVACYSGILHHFPNFELVAKEGHRILRPRGTFFSYDPHYFNPAFWIYRSKSSPLHSNIGITSNERLLTAKEIGETFSKAGFDTKIQIKSGIAFCYIAGKTKPLLKCYNVIDGILGKTPFARFFGAWVVGFGMKKS
ncbi:MAG: class I SAM-dependent methyltransferase [Patescibacteria group bacterium]